MVLLTSVLFNDPKFRKVYKLCIGYTYFHNFFTKLTIKGD